MPVVSESRVKSEESNKGIQEASDQTEHFQSSETKPCFSEQEKRHSIFLADILDEDIEYFDLSEELQKIKEVMESQNFKALQGTSKEEASKDRNKYDIFDELSGQVSSNKETEEAFRALHNNQLPTGDTIDGASSKLGTVKNQMNSMSDQLSDALTDILDDSYTVSDESFSKIKNKLAEFGSGSIEVEGIGKVKQKIDQNELSDIKSKEKVLEDMSVLTKVKSSKEELHSITNESDKTVESINAITSAENKNKSPQKELEKSKIDNSLDIIKDQLSEAFVEASDFLSATGGDKKNQQDLTKPHLISKENLNIDDEGNNSSLNKKLDEGTKYNKKTDENTMSNKETDKNVISNKKTDEKTISNKETDEKAISSKESDNNVISYKETDETTILNKETDENAISYKETDENSISNKETDENPISNKKADENIDKKDISIEKKDEGAVSKSKKKDEDVTKVEAKDPKIQPDGLSKKSEKDNEAEKGKNESPTTKSQVKGDAINTTKLKDDKTLLTYNLGPSSSYNSGTVLITKEDLLKASLPGDQVEDEIVPMSNYITTDLTEKEVSFKFSMEANSAQPFAEEMIQEECIVPKTAAVSTALPSSLDNKVTTSKFSFLENDDIDEDFSESRFKKLTSSEQDSSSSSPIHSDEICTKLETSSLATILGKESSSVNHSEQETLSSSNLIDKKDRLTNTYEDQLVDSITYSLPSDDPEAEDQKYKDNEIKVTKYTDQAASASLSVDEYLKKSVTDDSDVKHKNEMAYLGIAFFFVLVAYMFYFRR